MTATEMRLCLAALHWSQEALQRILGVGRKTVNSWADGSQEIPPRVADWLRELSAPARAKPLPDGWNR